MKKKLLFIFTLVASALLSISLMSCGGSDDDGSGRGSGSSGGSAGGMSRGQFTIDDAGKKVYFSKGNLQLVGENQWKFADHQWDFFYKDRYDNHRDLFGQGSGNNPNEIYGENDKTYTLVDWGDNTSLQSTLGTGWRTLTISEWRFVLNKRGTDTGKRYAKATVNDVCGVILLPDNWSISYYPLNNTDVKTATYTANIISSSDWISRLEAHGAVFLPAAGWSGFYNSSTSYPGPSGGYWSCSSGSSANIVRFNSGTLETLYVSRARAAVRLVRDAE